VNRLGEFSPIGQLFSLGKVTIVTQYFVLLLSPGHLFWQKMAWATFLGIFFLKRNWSLWPEASFYYVTPRDELCSLGSPPLWGRSSGANFTPWDELLLKAGLFDVGKEWMCTYVRI
jgi:hypothetical protein